MRHLRPTGRVSDMFLTIGLALAGLLAVLVAGVAMIACGNAVFSHTIDVVVSDPDHRLGTEPLEVSVFDSRMGSTSDWARKFMGVTSDAKPYRTPFTSMKVVTLFDPPRPDELELALALPKFEPRGFFWLRLEPRAAPSGTERAAFGPYNEGTKIDPVPRLDVQYTATPEPKGWHVVLRLLVGRDG